MANMVNGSAYVPPSVIVNGQANIKGSTAYVNPATVALLVAQDAYPTGSVQTTTIGTAITLPNTSIVSGTITVTNLLNNQQLSVGTDYTTSGNTVTIEASEFPNGGTFEITYQYEDADYYQPMSWYALANVETYYGAGFNADGSVNNSVSAAANYAFQNGAENVIIQPFMQAGGTTGSSTAPSLESALNTLSERDDINLIVPIGCNSSQLQTIANSIENSNMAGNYRRGIFGLDAAASSSTTGDTSAAAAITTADVTQLAGLMNSDQIMVIGNLYATSTLGAQLPPSMYACAVAGLTESTPFYRTLTHKPVVGFALDRQYTQSQMNNLASNGITLITAINGQNLIRQALCSYQKVLLDWDYGAVLQYLNQSVKRLFENYIGKPCTQSLLNSAQGAITLFLENQVSANIILSYSDISVTYESGHPDTMLVSFQANWMASLNYVRINYGFNTVSGANTTAFTSTTTAQ